ncbi:MAG: DUF1579 family protein, partial [Gemmatimonadales bacterium]
LGAAMKLSAGLLAIVVVSAPRLAAQGGGKASRAIGSTPAAAAARTHLEPARTVLRSLVGTWRFEIRFAGNFDGAPDVSGTRILRALFDDLRVEWTEALDDSQIRGQGVIGFDSRSDRFVSTSAYSAPPGSALEFMAGVLDDAEPRITFSPISLSADASPAQTRVQSSELTLLDQDHFIWVALDRGWRAVFTRQAASQP